MFTFAEIGAGNIVLRVIVADSLEWCVETLGGWWVETYEGLPVERYAGMGMVYTPSDPRKFLNEGEM